MPVPEIASDSKALARSFRAIANNNLSDSWQRRIVRLVL